MQDFVTEYLIRLNSRYKTGISTEHSYRGDLQQLLEQLIPSVQVTNEPARIACGAPDYIISKKNIPLGYIEAKDIGKDLSSKDYKEQFDRYRKSLDNLIITDYLDFWLYKHGEFITSIKLAKVDGGTIVHLPDNFEQFKAIIKDFSTHIGQTIKSPSKLSVMMADKAKLLGQVIEKALTSDEENEADSTLKEQMNAFKQILIHDIIPREFADIYAQTIAYGMFAARLHDRDLETFSRQEAAEKIPKSNPFLRKLFQYIAGYDLDDRIVWIVDELADVFRATDVSALLKDFGKATQQHDPIIHFYETFLSEYDPKLRKSRGVWYTPEPVVNFIVRAVDDILKSEFGLQQGLADTSKTKVKVKVQTHDKRSKTGFTEIEQEVHKVQILDPATGTGTFLAEAIKQIYSKFKSQQGIWSNYVENHLIPRLNGFELLMASYAMAHLKLDLLLSETGYKSTKDQRFRVYLTNSLEEHHKDTGTLFAGWLSSEANEANHIKRDTPVMVVMGNPPYSGESANKGEWIMNLIEDYKKEPEGKEKLKERNPKWINDDYVKFIRYGQHYIEKNGEGILAFINPHGFLDNPTFRGMRWNLLKTYDAIYTIDLHGNSKKKETSPDGSPDVNVFDIQQGVSINFFIKSGKKGANELAKVHHFDLFGKREIKYNFLLNNSISSIGFTELNCVPPMYFMVKKDLELENKYASGIRLDELFTINGVGLTTAHDDFVINDKFDVLLSNFKSFQNSDRDADDLHLKFNVRKKAGWNILEGYDNIKNKSDLKPYIKPISYRPFDDKYIFYEDKLVWRTVRKVVQHMLTGENIGLVFSRQSTDENWTNIQVSQSMIDNRFHFSYKGIPSLAPLYIYPEKSKQFNTEENESRVPNLNRQIVKKIEKHLLLKFTSEKEDNNNCFAPIDILDYIYAVLHSQTYRERYIEFLKIDFPRVPYPRDKETFWKLIKLGCEIRQIHLLESPKVEQFISAYPIDGDNLITTKIGDSDWEITDNAKQIGRIWINDKQYFDDIPLVAWEFYIGGYQPAQKWLKDRKGRELSFEDIQHYQKIIVALNETHRLMQEIDKIEIE